MGRVSGDTAAIGDSMVEITGNDNGGYFGIEVGANYSWDNFIRMYTG